MEDKITRWFEPVSPHAHWLLRIALLSTFLYHGVDKFMGEGIAGFAEMTELPVFIAFLVAAFEIVGSLLIFIGGVPMGRHAGLLTRLGALLIIPVMLGAIFMVHWGQWHFMPSETHPMGGMQFQVMILLFLLYLLIQGNHINAAGRGAERLLQER